jgi:hypothetical protein
MLVIPLQPLPNQTAQVQLGGQPVQLNIYQTAYQLAIDVLVGGVPIIQGQPCQNMNLLIRYSYLGFLGDLCWIDTQGMEDPLYYGVGTRWQLLYLDQNDLAAAA